MPGCLDLVVHPRLVPNAAALRMLARRARGACSQQVWGRGHTVPLSDPRFSHRSPRKRSEGDRVVFTHRVIDHGRAVCTARRAHCERCTLAAHCPTAPRL